ncbi:MAG: DUF881 domain-containing protein, partial [Propionicimonas sp.]|nr:DUF881 domain-containing protein [Propionicimonas sp.]
ALRWGRRRPTAGKLATFATCLAAGLMMTTGALAADGADLRPNQTTDLIDLVRAEADRNAELASRVATLRAQVDTLAQDLSADQPADADLTELSQQAALTPVKGPAVTVTLADAPLSVKPAGVADELLVVHQQDIQAVANALWEGGAEAMTIQGQRVTSRTGIKCVGNTVLLHGVPYAPPYVITAIGDQVRMEASLATSAYLRTYREYVTAYRLGYAQQRVDEVAMPGFQGSVGLRYARPAG